MPIFYDREAIMKMDYSNLIPRVGSYRFGVTAVVKGYVSIEQVQRGLAEQVDDEIMGRPYRRLGWIFVDQGWITEEQMKSILDEMGVELDLVTFD